MRMGPLRCRRRWLPSVYLAHHRAQAACDRTPRNSRCLPANVWSRRVASWVDCGRRICFGCRWCRRDGRQCSERYRHWCREHDFRRSGAERTELCDETAVVCALRVYRVVMSFILVAASTSSIRRIRHQSPSPTFTSSASSAWCLYAKDSQTSLRPFTIPSWCKSPGQPESPSFALHPPLT